MPAPRPRQRAAVIVLYDGECGFCRWAMAWALRLDRRGRLVAAQIQSPLGSELLADLGPQERLATAHAVSTDGRRASGGDAVSEVLDALDRMRLLGRLTRRLPALTDRVYGAVARRRVAVGRLVGAGARRRADLLLDRAAVTTAAELDARTRASAG